MKWILYDLMCIILSIITMPIQAVIMGIWLWGSILFDWCQNLLMDIQEYKQTRRKHLKERICYRWRLKNKIGKERNTHFYTKNDG